jgi:hypothetical protein
VVETFEDAEWDLVLLVGSKQGSYHLTGGAALARMSPGGWVQAKARNNRHYIIHKKDVRGDGWQYFESSRDLLHHLSLISDPIESERNAEIGTALGNPYRQSVPVAIAAIDVFEVDPSIVERGIQGHANTQNALAEDLRSIHLDPRSPGCGMPDFDIAWQDGVATFVAEVKSITNRNQEIQLRLGLGQLLLYAHRLSESRHPVIPVLVAECNPKNLVWEKLCERHGVVLAWPEVFKSRLGNSQRD